jgi:hypothetical protein
LNGTIEKIAVDYLVIPLFLPAVCELMGVSFVVGPRFLSTTKFKGSSNRTFQRMVLRTGLIAKKTIHSYEWFSKTIH